MDSFKIDWKVSSERDIRKIDRQLIPRILNENESRADNPFPRQTRTLKNSESSYRLRIGDYRVIYQVNLQKKAIIIYHVRHRKDAYKR